MAVELATATGGLSPVLTVPFDFVAFGIRTIHARSSLPLFPMTPQKKGESAIICSSPWAPSIIMEVISLLDFFCSLENKFLISFIDSGGGGNTGTTGGLSRFVIGLARLRKGLAGGALVGLGGLG